jgi:hypothetical protein
MNPLRKVSVSVGNRRVIGAVLLPLVLLVGCVPHKDRSGELKGIRTVRVRIVNTQTKAPDLEITLPEGFSVISEDRWQYDKFYIQDSRDSGETQRGLIQLDVTPSPLQSIRDTNKFERSRGSIAAEDVDWREARIVDESGVPIYQREMTQSTLLKNFRSPDGRGALVLHALVTGSDPKVVEQLTASVETIKVLPPKPNL